MGLIFSKVFSYRELAFIFQVSLWYMLSHTFLRDHLPAVLEYDDYLSCFIVLHRIVAFRHFLHVLVCRSYSVLLRLPHWTGKLQISVLKPSSGNCSAMSVMGLTSLYLNGRGSYEHPSSGFTAPKKHLT